MLSPKELDNMISSIRGGRSSRPQLRELAERIRANLNPHPGGQKETNVPVMDGDVVPGMQHKYRETVLFFPTEVRRIPSVTLSRLIADWLVGSILSFLLHILLQMGAIYVRRF